MVFNAAVSVVDAVIIFPQCTPTAFSWNRSIPGGHCWPAEVIDGMGIIQGCTVIRKSIEPRESLTIGEKLLQQLQISRYRLFQYTFSGI